MKQFFASNQLSAYIDGELSSAEMAEVDRALRENPQLRQEYERLLATVEFVRSAGPVQAPADLHSRVLAQVSAEPMPGGFWRRVRGFFAGIPMETVAVAMAAVLVTVVIGQRMDQDEVAPTPAVEPAQSTEAPEGLASRGGEKVDSAVKEIASLVDRSRKEPAVDPVSSGAGPAVQQHIDPELAGEAVRTTTSSLEDGVAALTEAPTEQTTPEKAYQEGDLSTVLTSAMAYRLHVDDPRALRDLSSLAARHGGVALVDGQPIDRGFAFDADTTRKNVTVQIPSGALAAFYKDLARMGEVETLSSDNSPLFSGGDLVVALDVMYAP